MKSLAKIHGHFSNLCADRLHRVLRLTVPILGENANLYRFISGCRPVEMKLSAKDSLQLRSITLKSAAQIRGDGTDKKAIVPAVDSNWKALRQLRSAGRARSDRR